MERSISSDSGPLPQIYAGLRKRLAANLVDALVLMPVSLAPFVLPLHSRSLGVVITLLSSGAIGFLYTIYFHATYGQTLGKRALGITVLRTDGHRIGWYEAFWRSSVDIAFWVILSAHSVATLMSMPGARFTGLSWAALQTEIVHTRGTFLRCLEWLGSAWVYSEVVTLLFNEKKRALHDFIAGTVVALKGSEALVAQTQFTRGTALSAAKALKVGFQATAVGAAVVAAMLAAFVGFAFVMSRTDTGAAIGERLGMFGSNVVEVAPGVRLTRPVGWSVTDDGAGGHTAHALGSRGGAEIVVWSVPITELSGIADHSDAGLPALGPAVAAAQRTRANKALQGSWAAGLDPYKSYEITRSHVVNLGAHQWGEDFLVRHDGAKSYVLINRYIVRGDAVIVLVDGYEATPGGTVELQEREAVVAPVLEALEFSR